MHRRTGWFVAATTWLAAAAAMGATLADTKIAFESDLDGQTDLYSVDIDGQNLTRLTTVGGYHPSWSPDGSKIAFHGPGQADANILVLDVASGTVTDLTGPITAATGQEVEPAWSPDGTQIAFRYKSAVDASADAIVVVDVAGTTLITLVSTNVTGANESGSPTWSPLADRIAFTSWRDGNGEVYTALANGALQTNITLYGGAYDGESAWSPDGARIAFESDRDGNMEIFVMQADGSSPTQITVTDVGGQYLPSWAPDGS